MAVLRVLGVVAMWNGRCFRCRPAVDSVRDETWCKRIRSTYSHRCQRSPLPTPQFINDAWAIVHYATATDRIDGEMATDSNGREGTAVARKIER